MPLEPGSRLGPFEIISPLGAGGMGEVYRARDAALRRDVAIKVLPAYWSRDPDRLRRFALEAQAAAALNHPNIVSIFHVGEHDGAPYIVTELLQGESLSERLSRGPMRLAEVLDLATGIAQGLAAAHAAGIVHRDLKPGNVFLTKDGRVKILDFGLAKVAQPQSRAGIDGETVTFREETSPGQVLGTLGYMSPEQVRGEPADARSDIFALGLILYEMLTGKRAFRKQTSAETMVAILNEDPPPISQLSSSIPPGLQRIINRCLMKNPGQRFQHASDLAFALETLSDSSSAPPEILQQARFTRKWVWITIAAAVLAIVALLFSSLSRPPAVPVVQAVTQLTDDGEPKPIWSYLATDGPRVYFNEGPTGSLKIAQVAITGGPTAVIPTKLENPQLVGLSLEGSSLLAIAAGYGDAGYPLWQIPLPTGDARRLGQIQARDATFSPDGHIAFAEGRALYLAQPDGSDPHQLLSVNGLIREPSFSPDGARLVFTSYSPSGIPLSIVESNADGSAPHALVEADDAGDVCCAQWTPDGGYIVFRKMHSGRQDLWLLAMKAGIFQRSHRPVQLTNGPLSYHQGAVPSRDGKQIFAIGTKQRGELVRYDFNSKQFLPYLSGLSAVSPTFSKDGNWVSYVSYPDHTLWRSRLDGSDRLQLTYPPVGVRNPSISPDGKYIVYGTFQNSGRALYLIATNGGSPQRIVDKDSDAARWSPDGKLLVFTDRTDNSRPQLDLFDIETRKISVIPASEGLFGAGWVGTKTLVASREDYGGLLIFDVAGQRWSTLVSEHVVNWTQSPDDQFVYYTTGGADPKIRRIRLADHKVEDIASLKNLPRALGSGGYTYLSIAPDGSPIFTRDIGTQEIYALSIKWP